MGRARSIAILMGVLASVGASPALAQNAGREPASKKAGSAADASVRTRTEADKAAAAAKSAAAEADRAAAAAREAAKAASAAAAAARATSGGSVLAPEHSHDRPLYFGLVSGGNFLSDDTDIGNPTRVDQLPQDAVLVGVRLAFELYTWARRSVWAPTLSIELENHLTFSVVEGDDMDEMEVVRVRDIWAPILSYRGHLMMSMFSGFPLQPFVVAGGGGQTLFSEAASLSAFDTDPNVYWGGGLRLRYGPSSVRVDYRQVFSEGRDSWYAYAHELSLGIGVHFSVGCKCERAAPVPAPAEPEDLDGDGLIEDDECPDDAEDEDDFEDEDGCPDTDNDRDGIADVDDKCPNKPETVNGIEDADGCPEEDPDGDGLVGTTDLCPQEPEDKDGFQDEDGCPDPDNDADGIADASDKCPMEAETVNKFEDSDGCPDTVPDAVEKFSGVIAGIEFQTGQATIHLRSYRILNEAVKVLKDHPDVRIEIQGHTDSVGSDERNMALSQERANAVLNYLVMNGIDPQRLTAKGYGETLPIASNKTRAGRAKNRRVQFERQ